MTETRLLAVWLRSLAGLVALAGLLGLGGCGGGSGAPNNVFTPQPAALTVLPGDTITYSGVPTTLTIAGGTTPYKAFSSNSAVLPVQQSVLGSTIVLLAANVADDTPVTVTVQDSGSQPTSTLTTPVTVTVRAAPLVNSLTITPNLADCGETAICSGQDGTASVTVQGPQGGPLAGRRVRFDVVAGPFAIKSTGPGQPLVASLTVTSDQNGNASVIINANVNAPTQFAQIRATDLTSGQQLTGNFLIQQLTDGSTILTVVPGTAKITAAFKGECSSGFATDYYIYGGTPPYRVTSTFPSAVTIVNSIVNVSGGAFTAITNGTCFDPLTFSILDATGRQTTATLSNVEGTNERATAPPPPDLAVAPPSYADAACTGKSFNFSVFGGTPPYNVNPTAGTAIPATVDTSGGISQISGLLTGSGVTSIVFLDQSSPKKSVTATVTCSTGPVTPPPALSATPTSYTSNACTGTPFAFAIFGGTPPYNVSATRGTATPAVVDASGGVTTITGLVTGTGPASILLLDQSVPQQNFTVSVTCDPAPAPTPTPPPPALVVTDGFDYSASTCVGQTSNFVITGGTPPYNVAFSAPLPPAGIINLPVGGLVASGQGFSVTGLIDIYTSPGPPPSGPLPYIAYLTIADAGTPAPQLAVRNIKCP